MTEALRNIKLSGELGTKFGRLHRLAVNSTQEAIRALCVLLPGFERHLLDSEDRGVAYTCFIGKENIGLDRLNYPVGKAPIRIAPVIQGAKSGGLFQIVMGAAMIAAAFYTGGASLAAWGSTATMFGTTGAAFFLGGISQMLSPQQKGLSTRDGPDNGASYNFNGPANTTAQGNCVPLGYGEMIVGSATISSGFFNEDIA